MIESASLAQMLLEYNAILGHSGIAVVCIRNRHVFRCSRQAEEVFGWLEGELLGKSELVFHRDGEACDVLRQRARALLRNGQALDLETRLLRRDGSAFNAHLTARAIDPVTPRLGTVWIVRDITPIVEVREANARLLREQRLIVENAETGIAILRDRVIQRCNRRDGTPLWCHITGSMINPADPDEGHIWLYEDVTERRQASRAMDAMLREQTLIFDNAMIGISYQREHTFLRCNQRCEEIFAYPQGSLVGQSSRILFASQEAWQEAGRQIEESAGVSDTFDSEFLFAQRDGTPISVHVVGRAIGEASEGQMWIWTYEDVTAQRAAQQTLRPSHGELAQRVAERTQELSQQLHFMRQLVEAIPGAVFYKDRQGRYLGCNQAFLDLLGRARSEVIGATAYDLAPRDLASGDTAADEELIERGGSQVYESRLQVADGSYRDVVVHKASYGRPGEPCGGLVAVMLDITELRKAHDQLDHQAHHDPLTGLPNRLLLGDRLHKALQRAHRDSTRLAVLHDSPVTAEHEFYVGASIGISLFPQDGGDAKTAACQWAAWVAAGRQPGVLSVNVSGVEFARGQIQETAHRTLEASRLPAQFLELEITESAIMSQAESSAQAFDNLRAMGLNLVVDDFGTGYSSLAYLKRLPINKLKADRSFVRGLPDDSEDRAIVRAVIALAHSLQLTVIAEGVENEAQRDFLTRAGCDEMQGYLYGRPMPFAEYERRFLNA